MTLLPNFVGGQAQGWGESPLKSSSGCDCPFGGEGPCSSGMGKSVANCCCGNPSVRACDTRVTLVTRSEKARCVFPDCNSSANEFQPVLRLEQAVCAPGKQWMACDLDCKIAMIGPCWCQLHMSVFRLGWFTYEGVRLKVCWTTTEKSLRRPRTSPSRS